MPGEVNEHEIASTYGTRETPEFVAQAGSVQIMAFYCFESQAGQGRRDRTRVVRRRWHCWQGFVRCVSDHERPSRWWLLVLSLRYRCRTREYLDDSDGRNEFHG